MKHLFASLLLIAGLLAAPAQAGPNIGGELSVTLTATTTVLTAGEIVADTQEVASACAVKNGATTLQNIEVVDGDDQGAALDVWILQSNTSLGTENNAPTISDTNALQIIGRVPVATGDYVDLGGVRVATVDLIGLRMKCTAATNSLWVAVTTSGTPTFAGSALTLKLWFDWD